jgi:hypothetical protein
MLARAPTPCDLLGERDVSEKMTGVSLRVRLLGMGQSGYTVVSERTGQQLDALGFKLGKPCHVVR